MSFDVIATVPFERKLKRLAKKYSSLKVDLAALIESLSVNPTQGTAIGKDCYKVRLAITSKGKGKSGGARLITFVRFVNKNVYLLDVYDKAEQASITAKELSLLIDLLTSG